MRARAWPPKYLEARGLRLLDQCLLLELKGDDFLLDRSLAPAPLGKTERRQAPRRFVVREIRSVARETAPATRRRKGRTRRSKRHDVGRDELRSAVRPTDKATRTIGLQRRNFCPQPLTLVRGLRHGLPRGTLLLVLALLWQI